MLSLASKIRAAEASGACNEGMSPTFSFVANIHHDVTSNQQSLLSEFQAVDSDKEISQSLF